MNTEQLEDEIKAFDNIVEERYKNGFIPDLRRLRKVEYFYNNEKRNPAILKIHWLDRINNIIKDSCASGPNTLELGCGMGMLSLELARNGQSVTGVDISPKSIEIAKKTFSENTFKEGFGKLDYICADFSELEFQEGSFDNVIFFRSLHHVADVDQLVEKVYKLLRPGGRIILSEPIRKNFNRDSAKIAGLLRLILPTWQGFGDKFKEDWNKTRWDNYIEDIFNEYILDGEHEQSPLDNSTDDPEKILAVIKERFNVIREEYHDAFADKLIGGLRGEYKIEFAKFIKFLDKYVIDEGLLPPTSIELMGERK